MTFYVYTIADDSRLDRHGQPTVFYVGKGSGERGGDLVNGRNEFFKRYVAKMTTAPVQRRFPVGSEAEAFELERFLIAEIGRRNINRGPLTNLTDGGEGTSGKVITDSQRQKCRDARLGVKSSEETRRKISAVQKGKTLSREHIEKIAAKKTAVPLTEEHRNNIAAAKKGGKHSDDAKAKMSARAKGRVVSQQTRDKMSASQSGRRHSADTRAKMSAAQAGNKKNLGKTLSAESRAKISQKLKASWARRKAA